MSNTEKKFDAESLIRDWDDRMIFPLEYLQKAMLHAATEAVEKYEFEDNDEAFGLACLLQVFVLFRACVVTEITLAFANFVRYD